MATVNQITQDIINQARLIDPNLSLEVGTPERKIIEAVAESIANATVDIEVLSGQLFLDELSGSRIDSFVSLFGFARQLGTRATGIVTVFRDNPGLYDTVIPKGTQFSTRSTGDIPTLVFVATETISLRANETSALVRVECTTMGQVGNLPAGVIQSIPNAINIPGVSRVTNETPTSGGVDVEADENLKARFQNTVFRNMAGTTDQYLALALSHPSVTKANVIGPQSKYIEYLQVPKNVDTTANPYYNGDTYTTSISSVPYSKYTYSNNYYVAKGTGANALFLKPGRDFMMNNPANLINGAAGQSIERNPVPNLTFFGEETTVSNQAVSFPGEVFFFEHNYMSRASRNDWEKGIYNCVDVYVNAESVQQASSQESFPSSTMTFVEDTANIAYNKNYRRIATNEFPEIGNRLQVLYHQPMLDLIGDSITIGDETYLEARYVHPDDPSKAWTTVVYHNIETPIGPTDPLVGYYQDPQFTTQGIEAQFFVVEDVSSLGDTVRARNGIEWLSSVTLPQGTTFNTDYTFNLAIPQLQAVMERSKQITTDVLVHGSNVRYLRLYLTIMYVPGFTEENVNQQIYTNVNDFLNTQFYGSAIQMSDLLQAVHNTSGVDNVRWTFETPLDDDIDPQHKVEVVTRYGNSFTDREFYDTDFILNDDELVGLADIQGGEAIANALVIIKKAQNTWDNL